MFDWSELAVHSLKLCGAYLLALPVAWDREHATRSAGLRTFPLVAVASCGFALIAESAFPDSSEGRARALEGLITGIGFIGGGAIVRSGDRVRGTATATSIWCTGAIGAAIAFGRAEIALILAAINFATFRFLPALKPAGRDHEARE